MKQILLAVALALVASASIADTVEVQAINGTPTLNLLLTGQVRGKFGWSAFGLLNEEWGQIYAGPTFSPAKWCSLSVSAGLESGGRRFAESVWLGRGPVSVLAIYEHGYTGGWHKVTADYVLGKGFALGYQDQAFIGRGPRVIYTHRKVAIWGSILLKGGDLNTVVAATLRK